MARAFSSALDTAVIRRKILRELPAHLFKPCPARALTILVVAAAIAATSAIVALAPLPGPLRILLSGLCGCLYASLFFLGHEAGHGAILRSRRAQDLLMRLAFAIFLVSPTLWRVWHNQVHHAHTNCASHDPDNFGTLAGYRCSYWVHFAAAFTPGSGDWLRVLYLPIWFTVHAQIVLWVQSHTCRGFESLNRGRAVAETLLMVAFWVALGWSLGPSRALLVIVFPMLIANTVIMSYIATNHLLRPLVDQPDAIASSMSVTTHRWLDLVHFNFSHHVEHHLFPAMSLKHAPHIREKLREHATDCFLAPPHWVALRMVFGTPRIHDGYEALVDPCGEARVPFDQLTEALRCSDTSVPKRRSTTS